MCKIKIVKRVLKSLPMAAVAGIPWVGSSIVKIVDDVFNEQAKERIEMFQNEMIEKYSKLDDSFEDKIRNYSNFASLIGTARRDACLDIEKDKVKIYVSATINAVQNESFTDVKTHMLLNLLRDFTTLHIEILKILKIIDDKMELKNQRYDYILEYLKNNYKEKNVKASDFKYILSDLEKKNCCFLTVSPIMYDDADKTDSSDNIVTLLGKEFLEFISNQEDKNAN